MQTRRLMPMSVSVNVTLNVHVNANANANNANSNIYLHTYLHTHMYILTGYSSQSDNELTDNRTVDDDSVTQGEAASMSSL